MEKLRMKTESIVDSNVEKLKELFPNCVVEALDENGQGTKRVDFDLLKQELSKELIDENKERYQMTWPNKKQAVLKANTEIAKTLRPCREESEDYENTENIYIEGDNLDVLKVLRQTYMHKVKMIYIDPPYNTGNDFIYKDNYSKDREEYLEESGQVDEDGNRMCKNPESNGRFHTDWLNMIYPRLRVAKDLLTDDGVIFISIDDNEQANLKKVCDEIFGESNFVNCISLEITPSSGVKRAHKEKMYIKNIEYLLVYRKSENFRIKPIYDKWATYDKHYATYFDGKEYISLGEKIKNLNIAYQNIKIEHYTHFEDIKRFILNNSQFIYRTHDASKWAIENVLKGQIIYNRDKKVIKVLNPLNKEKYELLIEIQIGKYNRLEPLSWNVIDGQIKTLRGDLWLDFDKDMGNVSKEGNYHIKMERNHLDF